tara:strand:+ start:2267 stop:2551 length:285 start_codon:yes stop_codon:yes gene_type:complete
MKQQQKKPSINQPGWEGLDAVFSDEVQQSTQQDKEFLDAFSTKSGQKVLHDLEKRFLQQPSWVPGSNEHYGYYREGQNSVVNYMKNKMRRALNG